MTDYMKLRVEWENILSDPNYSAEFVGNVCRSHKDTILSALAQAADAGRLPAIGTEGRYIREGMDIRCSVIGHEEGWLLVQFAADSSTCIVRPSSFQALQGEQS